MGVSRACMGLIALAGTALCVCAQDAPIGVERTLVLRGLDERVIQLSEIGAKELIGRDARTGDPVRASTDNILALLPTLVGDVRINVIQSQPERKPEGKDSGFAQLVDGQRVMGKFGPVAAWKSGESLPWQSELLGVLSLGMDTMRVVEFVPSTKDPMAREDRVRDRIVLRNGDMGEGFIETYADPARGEIGVRLESEGRERLVAMSRVARVELSNPAVSASGPRVWLEDGSVLEPESLRLSQSGSAEISWRGVKFSVAGSSISAYSPSCERVIGLASCRIVHAAPAPGRRWTRSPVVLGDTGSAALGAQDILLSGPMSATWELEGVSVRVGGRVELPAGDRVWGDCNVVIEDVSASGTASELWRTRLHSAEPSVHFNVALPQRTESPTVRLLRVRVEEGERGPVQDRVLLRRVLVEKQ